MSSRCYARAGHRRSRAVSIFVGAGRRRASGSTGFRVNRRSSACDDVLRQRLGRVGDFMAARAISAGMDGFWPGCFSSLLFRPTTIRMYRCAEDVVDGGVVTATQRSTGTTISAEGGAYNHNGWEVGDDEDQDPCRRASWPEQFHAKVFINLTRNGNLLQS